MCSCGDCCLYVTGFFVPPLAVACRRGCGADLLINVGLWMLGAVPGIVHSWYIVSTSPQYEY
ncbi:hypothetical protein GQ42DRAFT_123436, partial [Ramicandelaber brevisporus]